MALAHPLPQPEPDPQAIRDSLLPEDLAAFDEQYGQAMARATKALDLRPVFEMLEQWRVVAWSSQDPAAHRRMLRTVDRLEAGEEVSTEPWSETKRRLGL